MSNIPAVILAGGTAQRLGGGQKPLRFWRGKPLISHVLDILAPVASDIAINANDASAYTTYGYDIVPDSMEDCGPLAGLLAGMNWAQTRGASQVYIVAGDTLGYTPENLQSLHPGPAYASSLIDGAWKAHPTIACWPVDLAPALARTLEAGNRRVMAWADQVSAREVQWPDVTIRNFNTPEDFD